MIDYEDLSPKVLEALDDFANQIAVHKDVHRSRYWQQWTPAEWRDCDPCMTMAALVVEAVKEAQP